jgi:hypothetical protein
MAGSQFDPLPVSLEATRYFDHCRQRLRHAETAIAGLNRFAFDYALSVTDLSQPPSPPSAEQVSEIAIAASNAVHQMRAALDNLICELVRLNGNDVSYKNAFPVRSERNARARKAIADKTAGMHPAHVTAVELCQPYHATTAFHPLRSLEDLWTTDKHKLLSLIQIQNTPYRPDGLPEFNTPGFALRYPDGAPAVDLLRRNLSFAYTVVELFEPALLGRPVDFSTLWSRAAEFRVTLMRRDPVESYTDDYSLILRHLRLPTSPEERSRTDLLELLEAADRIADSPVASFHREWLDPLRRKLTSLLEER